ncbi:gp53-like domain-containing protein [Paraburkholderia sp. MM5477-R1]|uniref:gp53-like domain-containing protein n=1 Tax=Paraburkholderia sp. MM5477-R1 TaxID=2991062 RepID=UPI003D237DA4
MQIILPTWLKDWKINNNTTGDFTVTCRTAAGLGAICLPGLTTTIYGDGTNINLDSPALGGASIAGNGYQELPGGLIMQWLTGASDSNGILTRPWPIPFPNALFGATATYLSNGTALAAVIPSVSNISTAMTCVVNVANSAGGAVASANVKVIALGN